MSRDLGDRERMSASWLRDALPGPDDPYVRRVRAILQSRMLGEEPTPAKIDRFVLIESVGHGGMGVVFAAFDPQLDRKVAIKLLHRGHDDARIVREAKAMAKLSHPNVAQVYEVGQHEARTFIAMEFVRGPTLRRWREAKERSWREIVALYIDAGRGLEAAHAVGLVHRDFKPDNAIVGADGRVRVLDFGLAREHGGTEPSVPEGETSSPTTSVAGTPAYMPPEQRSGAIADAKSDQYSFCVSLWEALHGARPFEGKADVPTWIRDALERGLALAPADRFASMHALLAVLADDPSRRRRQKVALGGLALVAVVIAVAWGLQRVANLRACADDAAAIADAWGPAARARLEAAVLASGPSYAADSWERLDPLLTDYADRWAAAHEQNCIAAKVDSIRSDDLAARTNACLDDRRDALASLVDVLATADPLPLERALPTAYRLPRIEPCADDGWLLQRPLAPDDPEVRELSRKLARSEWALETTHAPGGLDDARALASRAEQLGWAPLHARALMNLGAHEREPDASQPILHHAVTLALRSNAEEVALDAGVGMMVSAYKRGLADEAVWWGWLGQTLLARSDHGDPQREVVLLAKLGAVHQMRREFAEADAKHVHALAVAERDFGDRHPLVAWVLTRLAVIRGEQGKHPEALAMFERALALQENALGPEHPELVQTLGGIGSTHFMHEEWAEAIPYFERALAIKEAATGPDDPELAELLNVLASAYTPAGQHERGLATRARALALAERAYGPDGRGLVEILVNRGAVHSDRREYDEAMADFERALAILEKAGEGAGMDAGIVLGNIAQLHDLRGEPARAIEMFPRAIELLVGALGEDHLRVASVVEQFGIAYEHLGDFESAAAQAERALAICSRSDCRDDQRETTTALLARARSRMP